MSSDAYNGTAALVRTALGRSFQEVAPEGAVWRGLVGPRASEVRVDLATAPDGEPAVRVSATVVGEAAEPGRAARACILENDPVVFGRFVARDGGIAIEQTILGGPTMHADEVRVAVWAVGWASGAFRGRIDRHLFGGEAREPLPLPRVEPRRGVEERVASSWQRVERFLGARYGAFERDEHWGLHGGFGSARVFVQVRHYLETSTAVIVASPVLLGVDLDEALALDAHAVMGAQALGRFAYVGAERQLWYEHAVLGDDLDPHELYAAIDEVARVADGEDDRLQATYGGSRYADLAGS